mmetsp:Transcript_64632/g.171104  ORF Transcript_64632/g.171104 Transcript_64632/m.171104 type:complete len:126 (+) Transcript_64632:146-523(+)
MNAWAPNVCDKPVNFIVADATLYWRSPFPKAQRQETSRSLQCYYCLVTLLLVGPPASVMLAVASGHRSGLGAPALVSLAPAAGRPPCRRDCSIDGSGSSRRAGTHDQTFGPVEGKTLDPLDAKNT